MQVPSRLPLVFPRPHPRRLAPFSRLYRQIHSSAVVYKKQSHSQGGFGDSGDLFAFDSGQSEDLFGNNTTSTTSDRTPSTSTTPSANHPKSFSTVDPSVLFEEHHGYLVKVLGGKGGQSLEGPKARLQLKQNSFNKLIMLVRTPEQVDKAIEFLALWRESGRKLNKIETEAFIDRCLKQRPSLLVQVFSDRSKYGVDIPSLKSARRILHILVSSRPFVAAASKDADRLQGHAQDIKAFEDAAAFAALYPSYGLPNATEDIVSCILLTQAYARAIAATPSEIREADKSISDGAVTIEKGIRAMLSLSRDLERNLNRLTTLMSLNPVSSPPNGHQRSSSESVVKARSTEPLKRAWGKSQDNLDEWKWTMTGLRYIRGVLTRKGPMGAVLNGKNPTLLKALENIANADARSRKGSTLFPIP